ncbi:MAG: LacI family DNA-binding transcriptional regulator [Propionicimonas sp.]|uniref:LacI family DNA-binding transcriptional regulator n=1 Tax=Propionicimonas sp. TaxID=1955623 RepID=UPI003D11AA12
MKDELVNRPTMADVGRVAGVSPTTVSLVLNGRDTKISDATRERVLAAVQDLDYRPNRTAQGLRLGTTSTIGFLTDEIAIEPFSGPMIAGIHDLAWEQRSLLLMVNTTRNPTRLRAAVEDLLDRRVDGLLFAAMGTRQVDFPLVPASTPTLLVNAFTPDGRLPCILPDEIAGGRAAVEHVLAMGHRRITFLAGRDAAWATRMRIRGYREGLEAAGIDPLRCPVHLGNYRIDSGYEITLRVMRERKPPTALLFGNDQMATGAYIALARLGLRIPDDVSVVGYDDEPLAADLSPALTTVRIPFYEMGRIAAQHLLDGTVGHLPSRTYEPCTIIHRSSTNPPPGE